MDYHEADYDGETFEGLTGRDTTIFLIDASASMFSVPEFDAEESEEPIDCPFVLALKCVHNTLCSKIITAEHDTVGVVLFGTSKGGSNEKYGSYANTHVLLDLQKPDCLPIENLEEMLKNGIEDLASCATNPPALALAEALWLCSSIFSKQKQKYDSKSIYLFTNNDLPHPVLSDLHKQTERRVSDLQEGGNSIYLFPIGESFDVNKFYKDLLKEQEDSILPSSLMIEDLITQLGRRTHKKRVVSKLVFRLGPTISFGVKLYNLIRPASMPKSIKVDRQHNEPVKVVTTKFNAETAETLLPSEVVKYTEIADKKVRMEKDDLKSLKTNFPTGFTLLGFKPIEKLKLRLYVNPASFIYFEEAIVKGSRTMFGALLDRCKSRKVAAICSLKTTEATKPRMVALLPETSENVNPEFPRLFGFHVMFLPYLNDIRKLDYETIVGGTDTLMPDGNRSVREIWRADPEQIEAAKAIVKRMSMKKPFVPTLFENPALHSKLKLIEGMALNRGEIETVEDTTQPDVEDIDRRLGPRATNFVDLVFPIGSESQTFKTKPKLSGEEVEGAVESAAREGTLNKMTVDMLKTYLTSQGVAGIASKRKAELIELVARHLKL